MISIQEIAKYIENQDQIIESMLLEREKIHQKISNYKIKIRHLKHELNEYKELTSYQQREITIIFDRLIHQARYNQSRKQENIINIIREQLCERADIFFSDTSFKIHQGGK